VGEAVNNIQQGKNKTWYGITEVTIQGRVNIFAQLLQHDEVIIMCDGSEKNGRAAAAMNTFGECKKYPKPIPTPIERSALPSWGEL
jgi:hypothetical protein